VEILLKLLHKRSKGTISLSPVLGKETFPFCHTKIKSHRIGGYPVTSKLYPIT
jgi:hypothetical protein